MLLLVVDCYLHDFVTSAKGEISLIIFEIVIAYLLGSIPSGVWIGKIFFDTDIREHGSGNTGATNTFRILGVKAGTIAMILDVLKGTIATLIPIMLDTEVHPILIGAFAILGHVYSIYIHFEGGKAVATAAGVVLAIYPMYLLIFVAIFLIILYLSSMVSLASIIAVALAALCSFFLKDPIFSVAVWAIALMVIYLHRENINRIKNGTENRVPFGLRSSKK